MTSALHAVSFTPSSGTPNTSHTTSFTLSDQSSAYTTPTNGGTVIVTDTDPAVAPTISGFVATRSSTSEAPVLLFSGVTISDANFGGSETVTITQTGSGTLTGAGTAISGSYTISGTAAQVTSALQAASFTPSVGTPNTSHTTSFTLSDQSSAFATPTNGGTVTVTDTDPAVAPTISGVVVSQSTTSEAPVLLFSGVVIADTNSGGTETVTIAQTGSGTLTGAAPPSPAATPSPAPRRR